MITASQIVGSVGMSARPEFYSGRRAMTCDLSGEQLNKIYQRIKEEIGNKEAASFVTMVKSLKSLSATNFLNSFYALEANSWEYVPSEESNIDLGRNHKQRDILALATICSVMSSTGPDETEYIRSSFLSLAGFEPEKIVNRF